MFARTRNASPSSCVENQPTPRTSLRPKACVCVAYGVDTVGGAVKNGSLLDHILNSSKMCAGSRFYCCSPAVGVFVALRRSQLSAQGRGDWGYLRVNNASIAFSENSLTLPTSRRCRTSSYSSDFLPLLPIFRGLLRGAGLNR